MRVHEGKVQMSWEELRTAGQAAFEAGNFELCESHWKQALNESNADPEGGLNSATISLGSCPPL